MCIAADGAAGQSSQVHGFPRPYQPLLEELRVQLDGPYEHAEPLRSGRLPATTMGGSEAPGRYNLGRNAFLPALCSGPLEAAQIPFTPHPEEAESSERQQR